MRHLLYNSAGVHHAGRMKTLFALAFSPVFALQACADLSVPLPAKMRPPELSTCGAIDLQNLVGQPISAVDGATLAAARVIRPGQAVTMDYSAARLNIELDAADRIIRIWCG